MNNWNKLMWFALGGVLVPALAVAAIAIFVDSASRPPAAPQQQKVSVPWGAIDLHELLTETDSELHRSIAESFRSETAEAFDPDKDGDKEYALLALSGGGSNGAFGAGMLCGWTAAGTRPDFKVVTGVSTGSLQATFAFLGPQYDDSLREIYTKYDTSGIYVQRSRLAALLDDGIYDMAPLKRLIDHYVTDEVLAAVAEKHAAGHRLYVGTTNLDTEDFVIWDLGAIASSGRPDAREHYRNILLASSSVPVLFPPVYFEVQGADGNTYHEMHVDGSTHAQVFFRGFLLDFDEGLDDAGIDLSTAEISLYVIRNGLPHDLHIRNTVPPRAVSIASTVIATTFKISTRASMYRIYVLCHRYGIDFNLAAIPPETFPDPDPMIFDLSQMQQLYEVAYSRSAKGYDWTNVPFGVDPDEIVRQEQLATPQSRTTP